MENATNIHNQDSNRNNYQKSRWKNIESYLLTF